MARVSYSKAVQRSFLYLVAPLLLTLTIAGITFFVHDGGPLRSSIQFLIVVVPFAVLAFTASLWKFIADAVHYGIRNNPEVKEIE